MERNGGKLRFKKGNSKVWLSDPVGVGKSMENGGLSVTCSYSA